jgi:hypothetical protein
VAPLSLPPQREQLKHGPRHTRKGRSAGVLSNDALTTASLDRWRPDVVGADRHRAGERRPGLRQELRSGPLPSAEIDAEGRVYVVWPDCRFRRACKVNDLVMTTSTDGISWTPVARVPIDSLNSRLDHFIPGLGVNPSTGGAVTVVQVDRWKLERGSDESCCSFEPGGVAVAPTCSCSPARSLYARAIG